MGAYGGNTGAYGGQRQSLVIAAATAIPTPTPTPEPSDFGDFTILVGVASDWYNRRGGASNGTITDGEPMVGGMTVNRLRPSGIDVLVNIAPGGVMYSTWASSNEHYLRLTVGDVALTIPPSTAARGFGGSFGRYRIAMGDRPTVAAITAADMVRLTFVRP